jgi:hypothetical protein
LRGHHILIVNAQHCQVCSGIASGKRALDFGAARQDYHYVLFVLDDVVGGNDYTRSPHDAAGRDMASGPNGHDALAGTLNRICQLV